MLNLKKYILEQVSQKKLSHTDAKALLLELQESAHAPEKTDDIAIIGMSCKLPESKNIDQYWNNIENGKSCICDFPDDRNEDIEHIFANPHYVEFLGGVALPENKKLSKEDFNQGGYLKDVDKFDADFFNISPREAKFMEPLQRLMLETAWGAIDEAGYGGHKIYGTNTGVYIGRDFTSGSMYKYFTVPDSMHMTGSWTGIMASRISYIYNLRGPAIVIDTACSSGLVSVYKACQAIQNKECDMAIAGGICIGSTSLKGGEGNSLNSVESDDNIVRTFDKRANGTVWGEGVGALLLKPLSKAIADGDNIHAVIKGGDINNDGASNGITAPNVDAQENVIVNAWKNAKIDPETIRYVEAHGTGTVLGDPIELKALTNSFRKYTNNVQFCGIGSVKTNVGHLVAASGMASIIKVILALKHKKIPPTINFMDPNPYVNFIESPIYIVDKLTEWEKGDAPRRAGVSSFGFSGTNCHMVLEEAPEISREEVELNKPCILTLSAKKQNILRDLVQNYCDYLKKDYEIPLLSDLCYTANTGRGHYEYRLALVVTSIDDLKRKIELINKSEFDTINDKEIYYGYHKIVSDKKQNREKGEITELEKGQMTKVSGLIVKKLIENADNVDSGLIVDLCKAYSKGGEVAWDSIYENKNVKRVSVPVYPLERVRYWAPNKLDQLYFREDKEHKKEIKHPLLDRCVTQSVFQDIYATNFSVERHWVLSDHRVMGNNVIPGTTYLEMAREVASRYYPNSNIELRDIMFLTPLIVKPDEIKEVQIIIKKEKEHLEFTIASSFKDEDSEQETIWTIHTEGKIYKITDANEQKFDVEKIKQSTSRLEMKIDLGELAAINGVFGFGPRWFNLKQVFKGENDVFAEIKIPDDLKNDLKEYVLHPAMLDNAVNIASQSFGDGVYLPLSYKSFKLYGRMPENFYSVMKKIDTGSKNLETISFDLQLLSMDGTLFAEINHYTIKKVHKTELKFKELSGKSNTYYETAWIREDIKSVCNEQITGTIVIFKDKKSIADSLYNSLKSMGKDVIAVQIAEGGHFGKVDESNYIVGTQEEDYMSLMQEIGQRGITHILHLSTLASDACTNVNDLKEYMNRGVYSLYNLSRSIVLGKVKGNINIILVSDYINEITGEEPTINPHNAALFGMGKVVSQENATQIVRCIDIDNNTKMDYILGEIFAQNSVYQVAYRNGERYIEELRKAVLAKDETTKTDIKNDGVYIITGGTGGLGLEVSRYLASKNNVKLALINRSKLPDRSQWNDIEDKKLNDKIKVIKDIEELGSTVECLSADICNADEVKEVFDKLRKQYGKINGIVHCAGVAGDGFIIRKDRKVFEQVVCPKVEGTWILDMLTKEDSLDFFVMFSSITSLFGAPGQSDYTAANSYMDSFAYLRKKKRGKTIAINWPSWSEVGMAVEYGVTDDVVLFKSVTTEQAMNIFEELLDSNTTRVIPQELNYKMIVQHGIELPIRLADNIKSTIEKQKAKLGQLDTDIKPKRNIEDSVIKGKGGDSYTETELKMARIWAGVLDLDEIDIYQSFHDLGGDSILATQLLKVIETEYPGLVDISDIFSHSSVVELSEYIDEKRGIKQVTIPEESNKDTEDQQLKELLDMLETGETSVENAYEAFIERGTDSEK